MVLKIRGGGGFEVSPKPPPSYGPALSDCCISCFSTIHAYILIEYVTLSYLKELFEQASLQCTCHC